VAKVISPSGTVYEDVAAFIINSIGQELDGLRLSDHNIELVSLSQKRGVLEFEVRTDEGVERWQAEFERLRKA
jgi:hypothetical protein